MNHKPLVLLGLALAAGLGALFGLTAKARRREVDVPSVDWAAVADDPRERLTITWMSNPSFPWGEEGHWIETMLEERFGVEIKPMFLDGNAYQRKKPLMFAAGDVPDLFLEYSGEIHRDAYHGFLLELPYELLRKHAPTYVARINELGPTGWLPASFQGRNYGLPINYVNGLYPAAGIWRMDWLRNVGIRKVPETLDEFHLALSRLRYNDPDRNGKTDTYGMSGDMAHWWWTSFSEIFGAYGVLPYDWMEREGRIVYGGILPETKQALALLRQWYAEGLIDPDFASDLGSPWSGPIHRKFLNGRVGYLYYAGRFQLLNPEMSGSLGQKMAKLSPDAEVAVGVFPVGPTGHRGGSIRGAGANAVAFGAHLVRQPQKVIRVLAMFEAMARDPDLGVAAIMGKRGLHWDYVDPTVGPNSGVVPLPPYDNVTVTRRHVLSLALGSGSFFHPDSLHPRVCEAHMRREHLAFRHTYRRPEWGLENALGRTEYVPSAKDYVGDLRRMQQTVFTEIIRGERELAYFETFVGNWTAQGGAVLLREANELKALRDRIYRQVGVRR